METLTQKEIDFINEQKKSIITTLKNAEIPKEGAEEFMDSLYGMIMGEFGAAAGITPEMQSTLKAEWPLMKEQILKGYE